MAAEEGGLDSGAGRCVNEVAGRADLLEHVMETNGSYYWVSKQYRLPWYTLYNLDVAALFFLPVAAIVLGVGQCLMPSRKSSKVKAA